MLYRVQTAQHGVINVHAKNSRAFVMVLKKMISDGIKPIRWEMIM